MKRIINGKAYNTATAQHIATADYSFEKGRTEWLGRYDLYRTKGGAFFGTDTYWPSLMHESFDRERFGSAQEEREARERVEVRALSYDEAHGFVLGKWQIGDYSVELLAEGIFPSIPEAEDAPQAAAEKP